jgi:hypothetical protein
MRGWAALAVLGLLVLLLRLCSCRAGSREGSGADVLPVSLRLVLGWFSDLLGADGS